MKDWPGSEARVEVYRTSVEEDGLPITAFNVPATVLGFAFALYPQSITTFIISRAKSHKPPMGPSHAPLSHEL